MTDHNPADDMRASNVTGQIALLQMAEKVALGIGIFIVIAFRVQLDPVMAGVLGAYAGATYADKSVILNFLYGNSQSGKTANAALSQLAGAGPPPPAAPGEPKE